jgi:hypothetical protein
MTFEEKVKVLNRSSIDVKIILEAFDRGEVQLSLSVLSRCKMFLLSYNYNNPEIA